MIRTPRNRAESEHVSMLTKQAIASKAGYETIHIPGRIGHGVKTHRLAVDFVTECETQWVMNVTALCGSQLFTRNGFSGLTLFDSDTAINCNRCRR